MSSASRIERVLPWVALLAAAATLSVGLGQHGIWDPVELGFADAVRSGQGFSGKPLLHGALARLGFGLFGSSDWSGRAFGALACIGTVACAAFVAQRFYDARTAAYAALLGAATPLVVLNARWMVGDGLAMFAQALVGTGALLAAFTPEAGGDSAPSSTSRAARLAGLAVLLVGAIVGVLARGALLAVLPPLAAVAALVLVEPREGGAARPFRIGIGALAAVLALAIGQRIVADAAQFDLLLGGVPGGEQPPPFERFLQVAFHTLAPVSPLFVLAAARAVAGDASAERSRVGLALVLWATIAFGATTLFASRYGQPTYLAVVPVAVLAATLLRSFEKSDAPDATAIVVGLMLFGLIIRDYALYPVSPLAAVAHPPPTLAPDFQPRRAWAALFVLVAGCFALGGASGFVASLGPLRERPRRVLAAFREATRTRRSKLAWYLVIGLLVAAELAFVVLAIAGPKLQLTSIAVRVFRALAVALPVAFAALPALELALRAFARLGGARMFPTAVAALGVGVFVQGPFLIELSGDLSPRGVYATYNELRSPNDELVEFDLETRASEYYADGSVRRVTTQAQLLEHLRGEGTRWAMFRRNILPEFDRSFRAATGRHVFLADARNHDVVLAVNPPIAGRTDQNPLGRAVTRSATPQHPLAIRFSEVELIGYDLVMPGGTSVGAGQSFRVVWYWKVVRQPTVDWRIFLHVDGAGQRLNGDHDPVEGLLPTRQWAVGDVVRDEQRLDVPVSYPPADYTMYVGFYHGETRMPISAGPHTPDNRAIAGTLRVQ